MMADYYFTAALETYVTAGFVAVWMLLQRKSLTLWLFGAALGIAVATPIVVVLSPWLLPKWLSDRRFQVRHSGGGGGHDDGRDLGLVPQRDFNSRAAEIAWRRDR